ncbi:UDP-glucose 6-dehydrogenase [Forsythia ovata]|uniref:UDP-glucose 6-dehydrogenase n=1 Tax=Forsythia ovata TaxID=205694 RepID=A0ABD1W2Y6_9LAMI
MVGTLVKSQIKCSFDTWGLAAFYKEYNDNDTYMSNDSLPYSSSHGGRELQIEGYEFRERKKPARTQRVNAMNEPSSLHEWIGPFPSLLDEWVVVADIFVARITAWNNDHLPIYEPGFDVVVKQCRGKNIFFSIDVEKHVSKADIIFVSVNTPTKTKGLGAGKAADLMYWDSAARMIADVSKSDKIVVEKSTVPVKTAEAIERILTNNSKGINYQILSNPKFLTEWTMIQYLFRPDRVFIGGRETTEGQKAIQALKAVYAHWVPEESIVCTNLFTMS